MLPSSRGGFRRWRFVKSNDADWRFRLLNEASGDVSQVTPLPAVDGAVAMAVGRLRAVPSTRNGHGGATRVKTRSG